MTAPVFLLAAVEPSGDALGAALFQSLNERCPDAAFIGCGGERMIEAGFRSSFPIDAFAVMGFTDVANALPEGFRRAKQLALEAATAKADVAILIDGWAFSRVAAKRLRSLAPETKILKYAAPQIWASRPQRIDFVKKYFDGVLTLLPFEPPFFERAGIPAAFVGNPTFQRAWQMRGDGDAFRQRHGLADKKLLCVLPGSRKAEVKFLLPDFIEAVTMLAQTAPELHVLAPLAPSIEQAARDAMATWPTPITFVPASEKYDAFAACDAALAASGTVSSELAINGAPMVIAYKADAITAFWARRVVTTRFATVLNVMADAEVIPEFIQEDCTAQSLHDAVLRLLNDVDGAATVQRRRVKGLLPQLQLEEGNAAASAADTVLEWMQ